MSRSLSSSPLVLCALLAAACFDGKDSGGEVDTAGEADAGGESDTGGDDTAGADDGGTTPDAGALCAEYVDLIVACVTSAGVDPSMLGIGDDYCDDYTDPSFVTYFECYIELINDADCSSRAGLDDLSGAVSACAPG